MQEIQKNNSKVCSKNRSEMRSENLVWRINNMVPADLSFGTGNVKENPINRDLKDIAEGKKKTRQLLDLFAVSVTPVIAENGWEIMEKSDPENPKKIGIGRDLSPELLDWYYTDSYGVDQRAKNYSHMILKLPRDFFAWFFEAFDYLEVDLEKPKDIGGGEGYTNGVKYQLFSRGEKEDKKRGCIQFRYFDPDSEASKKNGDKYISKSAYSPDARVANYIRQKINIKLTGDGLQELRCRGLLLRFLFDLEFWFREPVVTMYDMALDLFNYGFKPLYFAKLAEKGKFLSRSSLNVMGHIENPTVYIGNYKATRTVMIYDKLTESRAGDGIADEPELIEAVEKSPRNTYVRVELHMGRKEHEADQSFRSLIGTLWHDVRHGLSMKEAARIFQERFSALMLKLVSEKCRFLTERRKEKNNERIPTDPLWKQILNAIGEAPADFAFKRPRLTLTERKENFKYRSIGGIGLFLDILREEGPEALDEFFRDVAEFVRQRAEREECQGWL